MYGHCPICMAITVYVYLSVPTVFQYMCIFIVPLYSAVPVYIRCDCIPVARYVYVLTVFRYTCIFTVLLDYRVSGLLCPHWIPLLVHSYSVRVIFY
jgi:hypothetical protein